jgi:hypothetical protein
VGERQEGGIGGVRAEVWGKGWGKEGEKGQDRTEQYGTVHHMHCFKGVSSTKFFFFFFEQKTPSRCVVEGKRIKDQGVKSLHGCFLSGVLWCTVVY